VLLSCRTGLPLRQLLSRGAKETNKQPRRIKQLLLGECAQVETVFKEKEEKAQHKRQVLMLRRIRHARETCMFLTRFQHGDSALCARESRVTSVRGPLQSAESVAAPHTYIACSLRVSLTWYLTPACLLLLRLAEALQRGHPHAISALLS